jgi:hypothetical protein
VSGPELWRVEGFYIDGAPYGVIRHVTHDDAVRAAEGWMARGDIGSVRVTPEGPALQDLPRRLYR